MMFSSRDFFQPHIQRGALQPRAASYLMKYRWNSIPRPLRRARVPQFINIPIHKLRMTSSQQRENIDFLRAFTAREYIGTRGSKLLLSVGRRGRKVSHRGISFRRRKWRIKVDASECTRVPPEPSGRKNAVNDQSSPRLEMSKGQGNSNSPQYN